MSQVQRIRPTNCSWVAFHYVGQLELARQTRNALMAVQAELFRLHYEAWDKSKPIKFSNHVLRELGFNRHDKIRALKILETAGWIRIKWRERKSPLVTLVAGFRVEK
jgi:hypothetical protein